LRETLPALLATLGVTAWSVLLAAETGAFSPFYPGSLWGERATVFSAEEVLTWFFMAITSWLGLWLTVYSDHFLAAYRGEVEDLVKIGVIQALLPFTAPLIPAAYLLLSKRKDEERLLRLTEVERSVRR